MPESRSTAHAFADLVEESLDEAAFLWGRWESELTSLTRNLDEVWSWTEDRLLGALDGVRASGPSFIDVATAGLASQDDSRRVTACAAALGASGESASVDTLMRAIESADEARLADIVRGLEVRGTAPALRAAAKALRSRGAIGELSRLKSFHRAKVDDDVAAAMASDAPAAVAAALRAAGLNQSPQFKERVAAHLQHSDAAVRVAAIEAGMRHAMPDAWQAAKKVAGDRNADSLPFLKWMAIFGSADEQSAIFDALRVPALQSAAVWSLGHLGTPRAVELCLRGMSHDAIARACGEAYCWITGADLVRDKLARIEESPEPPEFENEDLDANLVPSAEDMWPLPDADAVRAHWAERASAFAPDVRHTQGRPVTPDVLLDMIETGPMVRRPDLAFELAVRTQGQYDVETRALTTRQRQMMARGRDAAARRSGR